MIRINFLDANVKKKFGLRGRGKLGIFSILCREFCLQLYESKIYNLIKNSCTERERERESKSSLQLNIILTTESLLLFYDFKTMNVIISLTLILLFSSIRENIVCMSIKDCLRSRYTDPRKLSGIES